VEVTILEWLKCRRRRKTGRWARYYRRFDPAKGKEVEISLGVHGLHPSDPKVLAAWAAEHARWQDMPLGVETPKAETLGWVLDLYTSGNDKWSKYSEETKNPGWRFSRATAKRRATARSRRSQAMRLNAPFMPRAVMLP